MLIIVSGAPATGKTTLATRLAAELRCALVEKDVVKEALFETLGTPADRPASKALGVAAIASLVAIARRSAVDAGADVVLECNFRRGRAESDLGPLAKAVDTRLVHCETSPELIAARYAARPNRHAGHHDAAARADLVAGLAQGEFEPLELDVPVLRADTTDGYRPDFDAIVAFCRAARD